MKRVQRKIKGFNDKLPIGELCQRCGRRGEDRRTLWHACFYAMNELDVPFEQLQVKGHLSKQNGTETLPHFNHEVPTFEEPNTTEEPRDWRFFTLRVCKECRADWLQAIEAWFKSKPPMPESCGSGIFVRRNGVNVEVTLEEWQEMQVQKLIDEENNSES